MVKLTYISEENIKDETCIKYDNNTYVEDLIKGIEFPKVKKPPTCPSLHGQNS